MFTVATAAYPLDQLSSWAQYEDKISAWVAEAAGAGAALLVFPEYAAMELATLAPGLAPDDLPGVIRATSERLDAADALHRRLAQSHQVHILAASAPVLSPDRPPVNRARLFAPSGATGAQDKQIMTRFEAELWGIAPGGPLQLFETTLGRIGVLICYDSEFPLLGRALSGADVILVPSVTETAHGFHRVRVGARARALENQCVTVMSSIVGGAHWTDALGDTTGAGGVFGPPDHAFPETGILAQGPRDTPGWTYATIDPDAIARTRADGQTLNHRDWAYQPKGDQPVTITRLCPERP